MYLIESSVRIVRTLVLVKVPFSVWLLIDLQPYIANY